MQRQWSVLRAQESFGRLRAAVVAAVLVPALAWAADPQITSFIDIPDPVAAGGLYDYSLRVDNNLADAALNTRLEVTVPAGATYVSALPAAANCVQTSATVVSCNLGTVGGSGQDVRDVVLRWRALGPGPTTVSATAVLTADNDVNPGNNTQTALTTVISGANLGIAKTGTPNPVVGGANVTYTLTASNTGPNASGDIVVTDNLPPSVSFVSAGGTGWNCAHAAGVVTCTRPGPHPVNAAIPAVTLVGRVNAAGGTVTNSASIAPAASGGTADPDTTNNTPTFDTTVLPGADVRIAQKTVTSATPAIAGSNVSFLIQPRNGGPADATSVTVTDPLPAGWTFVSASGTGWSCSASAGNVSCTRPLYAAGAADDITVVARAPASVAAGGTLYTNTARIAAASTDPDAANNAGSVDINVLPDGADLRIVKNKNPNPVAQGSDQLSVIEVHNEGPRVATGPLRVVDLLSNETYLRFGGDGWSCDGSAPPVVVCTHPNASGLAVGAALPSLVLVTAAGSGAGTTFNTACTGGSVPPAVNPALALPPREGDGNPNNDCRSSTSVATSAKPDLAISKLTSTPSGGDKIVGTSESSVTYTLVVTNVSTTAEEATGIRVTDTVPAWIDGRSSFASITATASAGSDAVLGCTTSGATVTCTQSAGRLRRGETLTIRITVDRPLQEGTYTNTARVFNTAEGDPDPANNEASDTVTILPIADVEMTGKTVTPLAVRAGEEATYVLSFRNNGPSPALGVVVSDRITFAGGDSGVTVTAISSSAAASTCSIAAGSVLNPAADNFSCTIGTLANGEVQTITLRVRPNFQGGNGTRTFTNVARITTTTVENPAGGDNGNNQQSASLTVTAAAVDLLVNKTDRVGAVNLDPVPFTLGSTYLGYQVAVTNNGPSYATGVRITENMTPPAARRIRFVCDVVAFGSATCNPVPLCSVAGVTSGSGTPLPAFTCNVPAGDASTGTGVGELAIGATKNIWLRFEALDQPAPRGDVFNNVATVSANEPDTQPSNDSESEQTTTRQRVDLRTTKTATVASPSLMQPFEWQVRVVNNGPGNSLQTDLTDSLPSEVEVTGPITWTRTITPATGSCTLTGANVACALGQLDAGGEALVRIPVRIVRYPAVGTLANSATVDTDPDKTGGIDTPGGNNTGSSTVGVLRSSIAGTVFQDRDRSPGNGGVPQAAALEPRIAGVTVVLAGTDAYGNAVSRTATTDAGGAYAFTDLAPAGPAGYTVTQTQPAGYVNGPVAPPTSGAGAPSAGGNYSGGGSSGNSAYGAIALPAGTAAVNYNFPEVRLASLAGYVYVDANRNGVRDAATDPAIPGATVRLLNASTGAVIASTSTDAAGAWAFTALDPLLPYTLEEPLPTSPASLGNGPVNPGLVDGAACASGCTAQPDTPSPGTDRIAAIDLSAGSDGTAFNFGEVQVTAISGTVYIDRNRDNQLDPVPVDGRLPGVTLRLVQGANCSTGSVLQTTTTDADGNYRFANVAAGGSYLVCETQPAGYANGAENPGGSATAPGANVIAITNLPAGGSAGNHFGERAAALAGSVYADYSPATPANTDNGRRDAGETGIAGVPVTLTGRDVNGQPVSRSTTTDGDGRWRFDDLLQSDGSGYTVSEGALPASAGAYNDGRDSAGSAGGSNAVNDVLSAIVLGAGVQGTAYDFGELPIAPITGTVYLDRNRSGSNDGGDGVLPGVTIRLVLGASCSGTVVATTTTDTAGNYTFSGASAGLTYTLCEVQPTGYGEGSVNPGGSGTSTAANAITITNLPAAGSAGNQFGERVSSLAGSVYLDANNDGLRQGSEIGIAGVVVTLGGTDAAGNAVSRTATSDASGNFRFDDLVAAGPAGYTLTEQATQPLVGGIATINGRTTAGTIAGTPAGSAGAVATVPSAISGIALPAGADGIANLFGELLPATLSGTVFLDLNNDGRQTLPGDTGIAGVQLVVTGTDDTGAAVNRTITTGADGRYVVADLRPGSYTVTEPTQPAGTSNGQTTAGSTGGTATAASTTPSSIAGIVLAGSGAASTGNDFAEIPNNGVLSGRVWLDADNDGQIGNAETGIAGVTIELSGTDSAGRAVARTTTTDATGRYSFDQLSPGSYTVREPAQPAGTVNGRTVPGSAGGTATAVGTTPSAIAAITLAAGASATAYDFGEVPAARIAGTVYADNNDNGRVDAGEPGLAGVTVVLTGTDDLGNAVSLTTATGPDGSYAFGNLRPGTYGVTEPTQPPGTSNGQTTPGTSGGTATAPAVLPSALSGIVLAPGASALANNFGELADSPDLRVSKTAVGGRFTVGFPGLYSITVRNAGALASSGVITVRDSLPAGMTLVVAPAGVGWSCSGGTNTSTFSCTTTASVAAGATLADAITATVNVGSGALAASPVDNLVLVEGGGEIAARGPTAAERAALDSGNGAALPVCIEAIAHNACRTPTVVQQPASVSGTVWSDTGSRSRLLDGGDRRLAGWIVEVVGATTGAVVGRAVTAADGSYRVRDLQPGVPLAVRFRDPASNVVFGYPVNGETAVGSSGATCDANAAAAGTASSCVGSGATPALSIVLAPGQDLPQQSLPVDPSGVVYDAATRQAVPGAVVTLAPVGSCTGWSPATSLVGATLGGYTLGGSQASMTVGADGYYQFLFAPAAPASCTFGLTVTPPAGYTAPSALIPPSAGPLVPTGGAGSTYAVQPQPAPPTGAAGAATTYYLTLTSGSAGANVVHNHLPLDPAVPTGISLAKTGDKAVAEVGDSVRYTITASVTAGAAPRQTTVVDRLPAGFTYIRGTAMVGDTPIADPQGGLGPVLAFNLGPMPASKQLVLRYRVRVGVGAQQGDGINRARAQACGYADTCVDASFGPRAGSVATNEAAHRVRVGGGVFTTDACVLGKIYVDCNGNHVQDPEELGIPGVRLFMQDGTTLVSDSEGKYSVCGVPPRSAVLKVDPLTLPRGSRLTTSSNRNLGDAGSLWLDLKNGELHRADFVEGSCSNTVLEQVKARRAQGEVRAPEPEKKGGPALRFDSKAHGRSTNTSPQQGTDGANQLVPRPRAPEPPTRAPTQDETHVPTPALPMNRPAPTGRDSGTAPGAGGSDGTR